MFQKNYKTLELQVMLEFSTTLSRLTNQNMYLAFFFPLKIYFKTLPSLELMSYLI